MIHVIFSASAAGTLRQLLRSRGIKQRVVDLFGDLDFGPIALGGTQERTDWFNRTVPNDFGGWTWFDEELRRLDWVEADSERLVWIAPRSAQEQCGLFRFLSHFGGSGVQMVFADHGLQHGWQGGTPLSLGQLDVGAMGELFDECPRTNWDSTRFPEDRWTILMEDGALLRVVIDGQIQSVGEDYFDHLLLAACPMDWTKHFRVIGDAMGRYIWDAGHTISDVFLQWRLRKLIALGKIVAEDELVPWGSGSAKSTRIRRV